MVLADFADIAIQVIVAIFSDVEFFLSRRNSNGNLAISERRRKNMGRLIRYFCTISATVVVIIFLFRMNGGVIHGDSESDTNGDVKTKSRLSEDTVQTHGDQSFLRSRDPDTVHRKTKDISPLKALNYMLPEDGFASCIVLKDDNDRLSEWIAYHWLTLPLKYLIVAVDPSSRTTPKRILDTWKDPEMNMGMEILLWNDEDYGHEVDKTMDEIHIHRARQKSLLRECQLYHKARNRTWVAIIDPDEYVTYNLIASDDRDPERKNDVDVFSEIDEKLKTMEYRKRMQQLRQDMDVKKVFHRKTVFEYITEHKSEDPWVSEPCYLMPRTMFSAVESPPEVLEDAGIEQYGLNATRFSTLRYYKHGEKGSWHDNHFHKVLVDISRFEEEEFKNYMDNVHKPLKQCYYPFKLYETSLLRVHHYLGSWEQYSSRVDVRRSREKFDESAFVNYGTDYQLQGWLKSFVQTVGVDKAKNLLQHSGIIEVVDADIVGQSGEDIELNFYYDDEGKLVDVRDQRTNKTLSTDEVERLKTQHGEVFLGDKR